MVARVYCHSPWHARPVSALLICAVLLGPSVQVVRVGASVAAEMPAGIGVPSMPIAATHTALDSDACVAMALRKSARLRESRASVTHYKAKLAEVQALYAPRLNALGWLAPMFTVEGSASSQITRRWRKPTDWGPYVHLEAVLAIPLYTFGRIEAGVDAARARRDLERARLKAARQLVALEVRRLYILRLYALSLAPSLRVADQMVTAALSRAQKLFDSGNGAVSQVDLSKLGYLQTVIVRYRRQAADGARLAEAGLRLAMGLKPGVSVRFADRRLSRRPPKLVALSELMKRAARDRPEWTQLRLGQRATRSLARAERLANAPVVVLAGQFMADWAPTRQNASNPYHLDVYNNLAGGVALALQWDFNPRKAAARADQAKARGAEVAALKQFAESGIPTDVYRSHQAAARDCELAAVARKGVKNTTRWMTFAGVAYAAGTGKASDLVEGLVASLQAKQAWYGHLRDCHVAHADLRRAVGRE